MTRAPYRQNPKAKSVESTDEIRISDEGQVNTVYVVEVDFSSDTERYVKEQRYLGASDGDTRSETDESSRTP